MTKYKSRYMLVFDREGYSPDFVCDLWQERISIATYKKNVTDKWDDTEFFKHTGTLPFGTEKTIELAERGVLLQNKGSKKKYGQGRYAINQNPGIKHQL